MYADLHLHTYFSDSTRSPEELAREAKRRGILLIAGCDHDSVDGYPRLRAACAGLGIRLIPGVELTAHWRGLDLHILGLGIDPDHSAIRAALAHNRAEYAKYDEALIGNLSRDFPAVSLADYAAFTYPPETGCWRNTNYCIARGVFKGIGSRLPVYEKYATYRARFLPLKDGCAAIAESGGVPVLAHPVNWWADMPDDFGEILADLTAEGVRGIEVFYPGMGPELKCRCLEFCRANGLRVTAGSDDHGEFNRVIDGITYALGEIMADESQLDLRGLI